MRQHDTGEGVICKHCGATNPGPESTCIDRPEEVRPEPAARVAAVDDFDVIGARLAELRMLRDAAIGRPEETE